MIGRTNGGRRLTIVVQDLSASRLVRAITGWDSTPGELAQVRVIPMETESNRAAFYQNHKYDPDIWEESEFAPPAASQSGLSISLTIRFSEEEAALIRKHSAEFGMTYSDIVRRAVSQYLQPTVASR